MTTKTINIAGDFSPCPGGRYRDDGQYSGQRFREDYLVPSLHAFDRVVVDLDGTEGYGSSFLDEAFGGLVRHEEFSRVDLHERLSLVSNDPGYVEEIWEYID